MSAELGELPLPSYLIFQPNLTAKQKEDQLKEAFWEVIQAWRRRLRERGILRVPKNFLTGRPLSLCSPLRLALSSNTCGWQFPP